MLKDLGRLRSGLANRTAEKQKPGPLDLVLLFREIARIKKVAQPHASLRDLLTKSVQEYNKAAPPSPGRSKRRSAS